MISASRATALFQSRSRAAFWAAFSRISSSCDSVPKIRRFFGGGGSFFSSTLCVPAGPSTGFGWMFRVSGSGTRSATGIEDPPGRQRPGAGGIGGELGPARGWADRRDHVRPRQDFRASSFGPGLVADLDVRRPDRCWPSTDFSAKAGFSVT